MLRRRRNVPKDWAKRVPDVARHIEELLFLESEMFGDYKDQDTLRKRLLQLASVQVVAKAKVINRALILMKANKGLKYFPAFIFFPVKTTPSKWSFDVLRRELQFFSLQDLGKLALENMGFCNNLSLIMKDDVI